MRRLAATLLVSACAPAAQPELPPPLPIIEVTSSPPPAVPLPPDTASKPGTPITMTASNAPLREMLPLIAEAAGLTLLVSPEVDGRVTFHFENVPAMEALRRLAEQGGYTLSSGPTDGSVPFTPRTIFFRPAVNIHQMDARAIRERFGVGPELAEWIVLSRVKKQ